MDLKAQFEKFLSRKLFAFLTSSALLIHGSLGQEAWLVIALAYFGGQGAIDILALWRKK